MEFSGKYQIDRKRQAVWQALNDPLMLKQCIPGCESIDKVSDTEFDARVTASIGPVRTRFRTVLSLEDLNPPESYRLAGVSRGGAAGFARGSANVHLEENAGRTLLRYDASFTVGGKLAQVGSRLVLGAVRKTADEFFRAFSRALDPAADKAEEVEGPARRPIVSGTWLAISGALVVLLIWWFLLR